MNQDTAKQSVTVEVRKDEAYIKDLLAKNFAGVGNFQQFEFASWGMSQRPDFVILDDNDFTYFEIKSEHDTFGRLEQQMKESIGCFTKVYLVVPEIFLPKLAELKLPRNYGVYVVEDLELGIKEPRIPFEKDVLSPYDFIRSGYGRGTIKINFVGCLLWVDELRYYIKAFNPTSICKDSWTGAVKKIARMDKGDLQKFFELYYYSGDSLRILNEVLPTRNWNYRKAREMRRNYGK